MNKKKVLICGYYGHYNLGDEAMLSGFLTLLAKISPDLATTVLSSNPADTRKLHSVSAVNQGGNFLHKLNRLYHYASSDYFVLGGGDLLRDTANSSIANSWLSSLQKAIKFGCCTILIGISVGEIFREETKKLIPEVLNQVNFIGVRDLESKLKLENLGVKHRIHIVNDLALENSLAYNDKLDNCSRESEKINLGIAVRYLSHRGPSVDPQIYGRVVKEIAAFTDLLGEKFEVKIHLLPFQASKNSNGLDNDDYACSLELKHLSNHSDRFVVHRCLNSVPEYVEVAKELDLVVGMRLHALILSTGMGIPTIGIEYDPKIRYFMKELDLLENMVSLDRLDRHYLFSMAEKILQDLPAAAEKTATGISLYRHHGNEAIAALKQVFVK